VCSIVKVGLDHFSYEQLFYAWIALVAIWSTAAIVWRIRKSKSIDFLSLSYARFDLFRPSSYGAFAIVLQLMIAGMLLSLILKSYCL
jgi:hypothetical protein